MPLKKKNLQALQKEQKQTRYRALQQTAAKGLQIKHRVRATKDTKSIFKISLKMQRLFLIAAFSPCKQSKTCSPEEEEKEKERKGKKWKKVQVTKEKKP